MDEETVTFGAWLQRRRRALHLTQAQLAQRVACSPSLIRAIEAEDRRPSHEIAERVAAALELAPAQQQLFVRVARGELDPSYLVTHRFSLEDAPRGYEMFKTKEDGCVRAVFTS